MFRLYKKNIKSILLLISVISSLLSFSSKADEIAEIKNLETVGSARMKYLLWDVYDATLYTHDGTWDKNKQFVLTLRYLRSIEGADIADRSAEEIRKQGFKNEVKLAMWHSQMKKIFPDVNNGTALTGWYMPGKPTEFWHNGKSAGRINDPEFGKKFFDIWLAENTSEPDLRKKLLGMK